jgi:hypothetical protein
MPAQYSMPWQSPPSSPRQVLPHTTDLVEKLSPSTEAAADAVFNVVSTAYIVVAPLSGGGRNKF